MNPASENLDIALLRRGDAAEFTRFVRLHEHRVLGLCRSLGLAPADCDDAAAETFAEAYRGLPAFRGNAALATWVYRIAYRTAIKVRRRYPKRPLQEHPGPHSVLDAPDRLAAVAEQREAIWAAVGQLDAEQAAVVELFYRRGMSVEEAAGIMEMPVGTVKTLLFRARERLRFLLRRSEDDT